jgi:hypothetical protein
MSDPERRSSGPQKAIIPERKKIGNIKKITKSFYFDVNTFLDNTTEHLHEGSLTSPTALAQKQQGQHGDTEYKQ